MYSLFCMIFIIFSKLKKIQYKAHEHQKNKKIFKVPGSDQVRRARSRKDRKLYINSEKFREHRLTFRNVEKKRWIASNFRFK